MPTYVDCSGRVISTICGRFEVTADTLQLDLGSKSSTIQAELLAQGSLRAEPLSWNITLQHSAG